MFKEATARLYCNLFRDLNQKYLLKLYKGTVLGMGRWYAEVFRLLYSNDIFRGLLGTMQSTKCPGNLSSPWLLLFCPFDLKIKISESGSPLRFARQGPGASPAPAPGPKSRPGASRGVGPGHPTPLSAGTICSRRFLSIKLLLRLPPRV